MKECLFAFNDLENQESPQFENKEYFYQFEILLMEKIYMELILCMAFNTYLNS